MSVSETSYTFEVSTAQWLERERAQVVKLVARTSDGELAAPSSGTYTLKNASATELVSAAAVTISGNIAQYSITAATLPSTQTLGGGWLEEWALVMPDGTTRTARRPAGLCRRVLYPVISFSDLQKRHRTISDVLPAADAKAETYIDDAWLSVLNRLMAEGHFPHRIISPEALREVHLALCLWRIFRDARTSLAGSTGGVYEDEARDYRDEYRELWAGLNFVYDDDESGMEAIDKRRAGASVVFTARAPRWD